MVYAYFNYLYYKSSTFLDYSSRLPSHLSANRAPKVVTKNAHTHEWQWWLGQAMAEPCERASSYTDKILKPRISSKNEVVVWFESGGSIWKSIAYNMTSTVTAITKQPFIHWLSQADAKDKWEIPNIQTYSPSKQLLVTSRYIHTGTKTHMSTLRSVSCITAWTSLLAIYLLPRFT